VVARAKINSNRQQRLQTRLLQLSTHQPDPNSLHTPCREVSRNLALISGRCLFETLGYL